MKLRCWSQNVCSNFSSLLTIIVAVEQKPMLSKRKIIFLKWRGLGNQNFSCLSYFVSSSPKKGGGGEFWLLMVLKETTVNEKAKSVSQRDIKETHIIMLFNLLLRLLLYGNAQNSGYWAHYINTILALFEVTQVIFYSCCHWEWKLC